MATEAETLSKTEKPQTGGPPKRKLRNFLLNPRFQLKYTGMVVAVTVIVASILGYKVYEHSRDLTQAVTANEIFNAGDNEELQQLIIEESNRADQQVLFGIIGGILILALALGFTGIVVTHKVVGPSFKLRRLIGDVADGHLKVKGRLRKGDELQDVFLAFERMVENLRERQEVEIAALDDAIGKARDAGTPDEVLADIVAVRDEMQAQLD